MSSLSLPNDYHIRVFDHMGDCPSAAWDTLLAHSERPTMFMRHAYLNALETSRSACADRGWQPHHVTLWQGEQMVAACPLYIKSHSYGEYVFDWAWARAYEQHGLSYYPKAVIAVPFTPVPGSRMLASETSHRFALARAIEALLVSQGVSSLHVLFGDDSDAQALQQAQWMPRHQTQFHWTHQGWPDFDAFLQALSQDKRKKIRQERARVQSQGVSFTTLEGAAITSDWWDFFYRCYSQTYWEHGNPPYLQADFFLSHAQARPNDWVMFVAWLDGQPIASSLLGVDGEPGAQRVAYGRYWGALQRVDRLHFEACYYQPIEWCIQHRVQRFEGGAQGEHKMARALMPVSTTSWHWVADPRFRRAIHDHVNREGEAVKAYEAGLAERSPFKQASGV